jgi:hypothetical protein
MSQIIGLSNSQFAVKDIKTLSFTVREAMYNANAPEVQYSFNHKVGFNTELNLANFNLQVSYSYINEPYKIIIDTEVETIFWINDLAKYIPNAPPVTEKNMNVPSTILISIVSLSISHTRALLYKNLSGTVFGGIMIPILDAIKVSRHFFGNKINIDELIPIKNKE